jgi:hypothetical protein
MFLSCLDPQFSPIPGNSGISRENPQPWARVMYKKKRAQSLDAAPLDQARGVFRDRANRSGLTAWAGCDSRFAGAGAISLVVSFVR